MFKALRDLFEWIADHESWDLAMRGLEKTKWKAIVSSIGSTVFAVWGWFSHRPWLEIVLIALVAFAIVWSLLELFIWRKHRMALAKRADTEDILFDSREGMYTSDFRLQPGQHWRRDGSTATTKGEGTVRVEGGVLNLERSNTDERYELWLERYLYKGNENSKIPKDNLISGNRQIRVTCEAKASCDHTLRFTLRDFVGGRVLLRDVQITSNHWTLFNMIFTIPPHEDIQLAIFDQWVSKAPSIIQVRNLLVAQKR